MNVAEDFPEGKALLDPLEEGLQVGPAAIFPVFLGQSQELEAVQGGSQEDVSEGEGTATEPQLTLLPWREERGRGQEGSAFQPPCTHSSRTDSSGGRLLAAVLPQGHSLLHNS